MQLRRYPNNWRIKDVLLHPLLGVSVIGRKAESRLMKRSLCKENNRVLNQKRDWNTFFFYLFNISAIFQIYPVKAKSITTKKYEKKSEAKNNEKSLCVFCLTISPWKNESNPRKKKCVCVCVFFFFFFQFRGNRRISPWGLCIYGSLVFKKQKRLCQQIQQNRYKIHYFCLTPSVDNAMNYES